MCSAQVQICFSCENIADTRPKNCSFRNDACAFCTPWIICTPQRIDRQQNSSVFFEFRTFFGFSLSDLLWGRKGAGELLLAEWLSPSNSGQNLMADTALVQFELPGEFSRTQSLIIVHYYANKPDFWMCNFLWKLHTFRVSGMLDCPLGSLLHFEYNFMVGCGRIGQRF